MLSEVDFSALFPSLHAFSFKLATIFPNKEKNLTAKTFDHARKDKKCFKVPSRDWIQPGQWFGFNQNVHIASEFQEKKTLKNPWRLLRKKKNAALCQNQKSQAQREFFDWHTWHLILLSTFAHMSGPNILPHHNFQSKKSIFKPSCWLMLRNHMIHQPPPPRRIPRSLDAKTFAIPSTKFHNPA